MRDSSATCAHLRGAALGLLLGLALAAIFNTRECADGAPRACPPCAGLPTYESRAPAAPPAVLLTAATSGSAQLPPPLPQQQQPQPQSPARRQPRWIGSVSPLLMHLRCNVETHSMPNVLVANGVTGKVVVDVGMNAGDDFTIPGAAAGHKVYAFEPVRRKFAAVQQALSAMGASHDEYDPTAALRKAGAAPLVAPPVSRANVTLVWAAVGSEGGFVGMKEHPEDGSMDHVQHGGSGGSVPIVPLSAIIPLDTRIYLLKVDTEGHDGLALRGAEPWLRRGGIDFVYFEMNPLLMERAGASAQATLDYLAGFDYACMEASLSAKKEPYLLRTAAAAEYLEHRLPWFSKPYYANSCFTNVLCVHQSWLLVDRAREGGSDSKEQSASVADLE
jgi:FkbM family methyltransferase